MPLLPELVDFLQLVVAAGGRPLPDLTPGEARAQSELLDAGRSTGPEVASVVELSAPVDGGAAPTVRVLRPVEQPAGIIVYFHGGGWVLGTLDGYDPVLRALAVTTGWAVASVGYRLAPEHRYPTAVDDCSAALAWITAHPAEVTGTEGGGGDPPIVVAGDSAGGNLAAVVARRVRDAGGPAPAAQVLIYPVADCDLDTESYTDPANQLLLDRPSMEWFWDHYVADPARRTEPDASPLRAADLAGLPPALVITAEFDPLRDEGEAYAARLADAGVPTELVRFPGQMHGFWSIVQVPGHEEAVDRVAAFLAALPSARDER